MEKIKPVFMVKCEFEYRDKAIIKALSGLLGLSEVSGKEQVQRFIKAKKRAQFECFLAGRNRTYIIG